MKKNILKAFIASIICLITFYLMACFIVANMFNPFGKNEFILLFRITDLAAAIITFCVVILEVYKN